MTVKLKQIDVVILCGGFGTRLRPVVSDRPKALAIVGTKPFLDSLIEDIIEQGFNNIILCVGYMKEQIKEHYNYQKEYNLMFSEEDIPLGTGGALKNARELIDSNPFIVMNGDSICSIDFRDFIQFHINKNSFMSMAMSRSKNSVDFGSVKIDENQRITNFAEKYASNGECFINAGIYIMNKDIFSIMPDRSSFSLEHDFFPYIIENNCYGYILKNEFIDIGTPERYEKAIDLLHRIKGQKNESFFRS